jgi:hypothetical protein
VKTIVTRQVLFGFIRICLSVEMCRIIMILENHFVSFERITWNCSRIWKVLSPLVATAPEAHSNPSACQFPSRPIGLNVAERSQQNPFIQSGLFRKLGILLADLYRMKEEYDLQPV